MAPFDEEFFLVVSLGVGGISKFPDSAKNYGGKPWKNTEPGRAAIDFWQGKSQWLPTYMGKKSSFTS